MRRGAHALVGLAIACGPGSSDPESGGGSADTTSATADGETEPVTLSQGDSSVTAADDTQGASTGGGDSTGADPASTTSDASAGDSTGAALCEDPSLYRGVYMPGGLDRIRLYRRSDEENTCYWMTLVAPFEQVVYEAEVTPPWVLQEIFWNMSAESCDELDPSGAEANFVPDATGTIVVTDGPAGAPCSVSLDLQLQLLANPDPPVFVPMCQDVIRLEGC